MTPRPANPATPCRIHPDRPATHVRRYVRRGFAPWDPASIGTEHLCADCAVRAERETGVRAVELVAARGAA